LKLHAVLEFVVGAGIQARVLSVEDGLAGFQGSRASTNFLADSVASAQRSVDLSLIQYREGATDCQRVLDSQQSLLAQQDQYTSAVDLH
jgi:outer membrane protein TolC